MMTGAWMLRLTMTHLTDLRRLLLVLGCLNPLTGFSQDVEATAGLADWERQWEDAQTRESTTEEERLAEQTELLEKLLQSGQRVDSLVWGWTSNLLVRWESSADLESARDAYLSLLTAVCEPMTGQNEALSDEAALRGYLRKALGLTRSAEEEGRFLFYLAESWLRAGAETLPLQRRVESLLLQAVAALENRPPLDAAHFRLGDLYRQWGQANRTTVPDDAEQSTLTQAVSQFKAVTRLEDAREPLVLAAQSALADLLEPALELDIGHRFLPQNEVRISLSTRNVEEVEIELIGLPSASPEEADWATLDRLQAAVAELEGTPELLRFKETVSLRGRNSSDWRSREIGLGDSFPSGWYGVIVKGAGVVRRGMVLVTPLEVTAIAREDGGLLVWVADAETGQPVPEAEVVVLSEMGKRLFNSRTDFEGLLSISGESLSGWSELHVREGPNPGHLRRADLPRSQPLIPWIIANPSELEPGGLLQWCVLGIDSSNLTFIDPGPTLSLPDGTVIQASTSRRGNGWAAGVMEIPESLEVSGPIYATLPTGKQLYLAHVEVTSTSLLDLEFTGEQLDESLNLFLASSTIGVQVSRVFGEEAALPEYIRLRATRLLRRAVTSPDSAVTGEEVVFESILPLDTDDRGSLLVELPEIETGNRLVPVHVEALALSGAVPLAEGTIGLSPFRRTIRLSMPEHILRAGQSVEVAYSVEGIGGNSGRPVEGEFIVYRETWQSRYIHRRRGTTISEEAYLALPDRSLLGSAKTDYRLMEQGFVREEVQRVPLQTSETSGSLTVSIERPGYYRVEFDSREVDTHAVYPEGPLEVWLIPEDRDLRVFRSERPRLIVESGEDGTQEILLLIDRTRTSVLVDLERVDGSVVSRVMRPEEAALYMRFEEPGQSRLNVCRAVVVGNRRTDFLWESDQRETNAGWALGADSLFGLNPGVEFRWPLELGAAAQDEPILWTFFPESSYSLTPQRLGWQRELHLEIRHQEEAHTLTLSRWLPLLDPFPSLSPQRDAGLEAGETVWQDPEAFISLFPELKRSQSAFAGVASPFEAMESKPDSTAETPFIEGNFPNSAGRWQLALFSPTVDQDLHVRSWLISTELPIRSSLEGPVLLRSGDFTDLWLSVENTTRRRVDLETLVRPGPGLAIEEALESPISLQPAERLELPLRMRALEGAQSTVDVRVEGLSSTSEALHTLKVIGESGAAKLAFRLADPQQDKVEITLPVRDWSEGAILVASSLGPLLPEIWPLVREAQQDQEPLLVALGDWALRRVGVHHGTVSGNIESEAEKRLEALLEAYQGESGGWGWMPGLQADPWISSLVLWTLEIFSGKDEALFGELRREGRRYLETILIEENLDPEPRLFALRALAAPAFHLLDVRPSRIQARSFLDLLHQRSELADAEIALLLQVARAYGFREEVQLLSDDLMQRFRSSSIPVGNGLWSASLLSLSLDDNEVTTDDGNALLLTALGSLARIGPRRSWEQVAGFLNLLATYFWKGDFYTDGTVELSIDGAEPVSIPLGPELPGSGFLKVRLESAQLEAGDVNLRLNTSSALSPVLIAGIGVARERPSPEPLPTVGIQWFREFYEETLMQGLRRRTTELDSSLEGIHAGDLLRVVVDLEVEEDHSFAAFRLPVPGGFILDQDRIEHLWQPDVEEAVPGLRVQIDSSDVVSASESFIRIAPMPAGRHRLELIYEAQWSGNYAWPEMRLVFPRTGEAHRLNATSRVTVIP